MYVSSKYGKNMAFHFEQNISHKILIFRGRYAYLIISSERHL